MKHKLIAGFLLVALLITPLAYSSDFTKGVEAFDRGNYQQAYEIFRPFAEDGYSSAQYNLGLIYENGQGVVQNYAEAASWYRAAAEQGHADAQFRLSSVYFLGRGVKQNYVQAHMWANIAAFHGHETAVRVTNVLSELMTTAQIQEAQKLAQEWVNSH